MTAPRVLLMCLSIRTSAKGTEYLSGFLGAARVVAFKAKELDKYGNEQWEVYVAEPEPKSNGDQSPRPSIRNAERGQHQWDRARDIERHATRTRASAAGEAVLAQAGRSAEQGHWIDDTDLAIADLQGRGR